MNNINAIISKKWRLIFANNCASGHLDSFFQVTANKRFLPNEVDLIKTQLQVLQREMKEMKARNADMTANYNTLMLTNNNGMGIIWLSDFLARTNLTPQYPVGKHSFFIDMNSTLQPT